MPVDHDAPDAARQDELRPWTPPCVPLELLTDPARLSYLLVDEIVGDTVTLAIAPWPGSDRLGRVRFPRGVLRSTGHLVVHRDELHEQLYKGWMRRAPRVGDAFAAVLGDAVSARLAASGEVILDRTVRLADALPGAVADLTAEARNVAKLAFYAAVAGVQPHEQAETLGQAPPDGNGPGPRVGRVRRTPWTGGVLIPGDGGAAAVRQRWTVPGTHWPAGQDDPVTAIRDNPTALFYILLNIGDGDTQLLLLPEECDPAQPHEPTPRRAIVVDAGSTKKLLRLMADLGDIGLLPPGGGADQVCALVVATHPHDDHIEGLAEVVETYGHAASATSGSPATTPPPVPSPS